jgi:hypothetical protein
MLDIGPKSTVFILEHCDSYFIEQLQGLESRLTSTNSGMVLKLKIPHARRNEGFK